MESKREEVQGNEMGDVYDSGLTEKMSEAGESRGSEPIKTSKQKSKGFSRRGFLKNAGTLLALAGIGVGGWLGYDGYDHYKKNQVVRGVTLEQTIAEGRYPTYPEICGMLEDLHAQYPDITELFDIGESDEGRLIRGIRVGGGDQKYLITGGMHGNEKAAVSIVLGQIDKTTRERDIFDTLTNQDIEVNFVPVLNPDGFETNQRWSQSAFNLRVQFPPQEDRNEGKSDLKGMVSPLQHLISFINQEKFAWYLDYHTGASIIPDGLIYLITPEVNEEDLELYQLSLSSMSDKLQWYGNEMSSLDYYTAAKKAIYEDSHKSNKDKKKITWIAGKCAIPSGSLLTPGDPATAGFGYVYDIFRIPSICV